MDSPEAIVQLVIKESERFIAYLHTLSPEAWRTPSACDRWEMRDVMAHLAGQGEFYANAITRSLQGEPAPPGGGVMRSFPKPMHLTPDVSCRLSNGQREPLYSPLPQPFLYTYRMRRPV
jgi:hypothetical protein